MSELTLGEKIGQRLQISLKPSEGFERLPTREGFDITYELKRYYALHKICTHSYGFDTIYDYLHDFCEANRPERIGIFRKFLNAIARRAPTPLKYDTVYYRILDENCSKCFDPTKLFNELDLCAKCSRGFIKCGECGTYTRLKSRSGDMICPTCRLVDLEFDGVES